MDERAKGGFARFAAEQSESLQRLGYVVTADPVRAGDLARHALEKAAARWNHLTNPDVYVRRVLFHRFLLTARMPAETLPWADISPRQRAILALRCLEDYDDPAIAAILRMNPAAVHQQWERGLAAAESEEAARQSMSELAHQAEFVDLSDTGHTGHRRRRIRVLATCAAVLAVVLSLAGTAVAQHYSSSVVEVAPLFNPAPSAPRDPARRHVVSGYELNTPGTRVLDPLSGTYRVVHDPVAAVSPNLRYVLTQRRVERPGGAVAYEYSFYDTTTGQVGRELPAMDYSEAWWSPNGRWIAFAHYVAPTRSQRYIDRVLFLDVVTGKGHQASVWLVDRDATAVVGWTSESLSIALSTAGRHVAVDPEYVLLTLNGGKKVMAGWPDGFRPVGMIPGGNFVVLKAKSDPTRTEPPETIVFDIRSGKIMRRYVPRPAPRGTVYGWLNINEELIVDKNRISAFHVRTGMTRTLIVMPEPVTDFRIAPGGGLAKTARKLAF